MTDKKKSPVIAGMAGGFAVVAIVVVVVARIMGVDWPYALFAGVFIGVVVGGGLGLLLAARVYPTGSDT